MGLPEKFDKRLKNNLGLRAVWLPGTNIKLGDVLQRRDGIFQPISNLSNFGVNFVKKELLGELSLTFQARGVSSTVLQSGIEVDPTQIDAEIDAELKIEFKSKDTYFIRTPKLTGWRIDNLIKVGKDIIGHRDWRYKEYFIAWGMYQAIEFVFLGSQSKNKMIHLQGRGSVILDFLTVGANAKDTIVRKSNVNIRIIGKGGPVAMSVARIKKDGQIY